MDRLQGTIGPPFFEENLNLECFEKANAMNFAFRPSLTTENVRVAEPFTYPSFEDNMPLLQMLEGESPPISLQTGPNFQLLLKLQEHKKAMTNTYFDFDSQIPSFELESCITQVSEPHSQAKWQRKPFPNGEKRKRKRTRTSKNREEVESQRMTHIAVERNRRKQINDHLSSLRSLMPSSFVQKGDQASIIGGAIDYIKELEQLLQSLQAQKQMRRESEEEEEEAGCSTVFDGFFMSPQDTIDSLNHTNTHFKCLLNGGGYVEEGDGRELSAENKSAVADIEVRVIQTHANLKIQSPKRPRQLLKVILALEELCFAILHLSVTSSEDSVLYSFNLKIEEGCKLGSAEEIAAAVCHIFSYVNGN